MVDTLMITPHTIARRADRVVWHPLSGERGAVLLHLDTGAYHDLSGVGALIWDLLAEPIAIGRLQERIQAAFDAPPADLAADVQQFLLQLQQRELVVLEEPATDPSSPP